MKMSEHEIPATYFDGDLESQHVDLAVYLSKNGMVTIGAPNEEGDTPWFIQMSPLVARRFADNLRDVIRDAASEMLDDLE